MTETKMKPPREKLRLRHVELSEYDRKQIRDEAAERQRNG